MTNNKKITLTLPRPLSYQEEIMNWLDSDDVKYVSFLKSRQSGGSFLNKLMLIKWVQKSKTKIGYVTPTLKLSKLFFGELVESLGIIIKSSNATDLKLTFINGSTLQFFSSESKDSIRGFQFEYLIIDEAAFIDDDVWYYVLKPTILIRGLKILMCSTPNTCQGFFYQTCQFGLEDQSEYKTKCITIYDNPFISKDEIEKIKAQIPDKVFRQEYLAEFLSSAGSVFENYERCINKNINTNKIGGCVAAIDWGKEDSTVLTIMNMSTDNKAQVIHRTRINQMPYIQIVDKISNVLNQFKPNLCVSEENNIGTVCNELLAKRYKGKMKLVTLNNESKRAMIEKLIVAFEQEKIYIDDDEVMLKELQVFTCTFNPTTQVVKYAAKAGMHDDCVISLAYAFSAIDSLKNDHKIFIINRNNSHNIISKY